MLSPLYLLYQQWLQCIQDGTKYTLNLISNFLLQVSLNLLMLIVFHQGVFGMILSSFIVSVIFFVYSIISFLPHVTLLINKKMAVSAMKYSIPLIPHSVSGYLSVMLDRVLLNRIVGIQQVGLYGIANQFGNILNLVTSSINQAFTPWLYQKLEKKDESLSYEPIYKFAEISNVLCCLAALLITMFSPELIQLMTTEEFYSSWQPIVFITFGYVLNGLYFFFSKSLFLSYTKYVMIISLSTVFLNFIFNIILIPHYNYIGAGLSFLLSQFVSSMLALILSMKLVPYLRYHWKKMYLTCVVFFLLCTMIFFLQLIDNWGLRLMLKIIFTHSIVGAIFYLYRDSLRLFKNQIFKKK